MSNCAVIEFRLIPTYQDVPLQLAFWNCNCQSLLKVKLGNSGVIEQDSTFHTRALKT